MAIPVFLLALGANSIWDANEAFYVETPRQMVVTGDYVNPSFNGLPRFNKPVLSYWIVAGFYHLFGVSVAVERAAIAMGALGLLLGAFLIGRALRSNATGALAALLLATAPRFVFFARRIFIDVYIALFMTLALACFVLAERHPEQRRRYLVLMYVALGLGVLTKGPIALVIPAVACAAWLTAERRLADVKRLMLPAGALIVAAIAVPWYVAIYAEHGWEYIRFFFVDENLGRYANPFTGDRSPFFFLFVLFGDILLPWAPLIAIPIVTAWRRAGRENRTDATRRLLWWWVTITVAIFSFSASKEDLYILPAIPAAAVLVADLLVSSGYGSRHRGVRAVLMAIAGLDVVLAALIVAFFTNGPYALASAPVLAGVLAVAGVLAFTLLTRRSHAAAVMTIAAGFVSFNYFFVLWALPDVERMKPAPLLAQVVTRRASPAAALGSFNVGLPSFVYYAGRPVEQLDDVDQAARFLTDHAEAWMLAGEGEWTDLHARIPAACIAARRPAFLSRGSDIMRGQPPPDVLLITNNCR